MPLIFDLTYLRLTSDVGEDGVVHLRVSVLGLGVLAVNRVFLCRYVEMELKLNANASLL